MEPSICVGPVTTAMSTSITRSEKGNECAEDVVLIQLSEDARRVKSVGMSMYPSCAQVTPSMMERRVRSG